MNSIFRKNRISFVVGATVLAFATAIPEPAQALFGSGCAAVVRSQHSRTRNYIQDQHRSTQRVITSEIRRQTMDLIEAMQFQTAELGSRLDRQVEASRRISDAEQQNATFRQRQQFRAEAESGKFDPNPFMCSLLDMYGGSGGGSGAGRVPAGNDVSSRRTAFHQGSGPMAGEVLEGGSRLARAMNDERSRLAEALAGVSEYPTTDFSLIHRHPTLDDNEDVKDAIAMAISNLFGPPPRPITDDQLNTPSGQAEALVRDRILAMQRSAEQTLNLSMNLRDALPEADVEAFRRTAGDSAYNIPIGDTISEMQMIDIRTVSQYAPSAARATQVSTFSEKQLLHEILQGVAVGNRIKFLNLEAQLRNGNALAAIVAGLIPEATNIQN